MELVNDTIVKLTLREDKADQVLNTIEKRYINLNMVAFGVLNVTYDDIKDNPPSDPYLDISLFQQKLETYIDKDDDKNQTSTQTEFTSNVKRKMENLIKQKNSMREINGSFPIVYYSDAWKTYEKYKTKKLNNKSVYQEFEKEITEINMRTPMGTMDVLYNFIHHNSVNYSYTVNDKKDDDNKDDDIKDDDNKDDDNKDDDNKFSRKID